MFLESFKMDFLDKSAFRNQEVKGYESWKLYSTTIISLVANKIDAVKSFLSQFLGGYYPIMNLMLFIVFIYLTLDCIIEKKEIKDNSAVMPATRIIYSQPNIIRQVSKFLFIFGLIGLPFFAYNEIQKVIPYPDSIEGRLIYIQDMAPLKHSFIRLLSSNGEVQSSKTWKSDSKGFFGITCDHAILKTSKLSITTDGNKPEAYIINLSSADSIRYDENIPDFLFLITQK